MFPSSCGRLAKSGFASPKSCVAARASSTPAAAGCIRPLTYRSHQRRQSSSSSSSSSKPSNSADGSRAPPQQQEQQQQQQQQKSSNDVATQAPASQDESQPSTRISRRKSRERVPDTTANTKEEVLMNLPSVPSTRDVHPADVAISAFFSLHRPISVTASVPKFASNKSFETIFTSRKPMRPSEVIGTLSSAVQSLEAAESNLKSFEPDLHAAAMSASVSNNPHHIDGPPSDSPLKFPSHLLSGRYQPFTPPPTPISSEASEAASTKQHLSSPELPSTTLKRSYSTILTILERTHTNGSKTYTAHASPITSADGSSEVRELAIVGGNAVQNASTSPNPSSFLGRMQLRQERWEEFRRERMGEWKERPGAGRAGQGQQESEGEFEGMWAISVKRQRRLKMKKHKYKKLMRKTRNLRRRLEKN